jgi:hypothetical protein
MNVVPAVMHGIAVCSQNFLQYRSMSTKAEILRLLITYLFIKGSFFLPLAWIAFILNRNADADPSAS